MTKALYTGIDGVARKAKAMYVGVDGVARKVKSAYIGVDGVARKFYDSAPMPMRHVALLQPDNGSISASYGGVTYTSSFDVPDGAEVSFSCTPDSGYQFVTFTMPEETLFESINLEVNDTTYEASIELTIPDGVNIIRAEITPVTPNTISVSTRAVETLEGIYMVNDWRSTIWLDSGTSYVTTLSGYVKVVPYTTYRLQVYAVMSGMTTQDFKVNFYCGPDCENKEPDVDDSEHSGGSN